jgi:hypothetical protein
MTAMLDVAKVGSPGLVVPVGGAWAVTPVADLLGFRSKVVSVRNRGSNPLTAAELQVSAVSADAADADWETIDDTAFATLAAGELKSLAFTDAHAHWRLRSGLGTVVDVYLLGGA